MNAFLQAGVSPWTPRGEIESRVEALALARGEEVASAVLDDLTVGARRLPHELRWPGRIGVEGFRSVLRSWELSNVVPADMVAPSLGYWAGVLLEAGNAAARASSVHVGASSVYEAVAELADVVDLDWDAAAAEQIDSYRRDAGFRDRPVETDLEAAMLAWREEVAGGLLRSFWSRSGHGVADSDRRSIPARGECLPVTFFCENPQGRAFVALLTGFAERAVAAGDRGVPVLVRLLVDRYGLLVSGAADSLGEVLKRDLARLSDTPNVSSVVADLGRWDALMQPVQLIARAEGRSDPSTEAIAWAARSAAIELHNRHGRTADSFAISKACRALFAEEEVFAERVDGDVEILAEQLRLKEKRAAEEEAWAGKITYEADVGVVSKRRLRISPLGVEWQGERVPLEAISSTCWGGTSHSINGIPTGTTFSITIRSETSDLFVELRRRKVFDAFVECLWLAVGPRLIQEILEGLRDGREYAFGDALVRDTGVELVEHRGWFRSDRRVWCPWGEVVIGHPPGSLSLASKIVKKACVHLSYQHHGNVHFLASTLRMFRERPGQRLSDLLASRD